MNRIEYRKDIVYGVYVAHATYMNMAGNTFHVYATGRTMDLLHHNMKQNLHKKHINPDLLVWDGNPSDKIDMTWARNGYVRWASKRSKYMARQKYAKRKPAMPAKQDEPIELPNKIDANSMSGETPKCFVVRKGDEFVVYEARIVYKGKCLFDLLDTKK